MESKEQRFTEYYKSTKKEGKELYFCLTFEIYNSTYDKGISSHLRLKIKISYLALITNGTTIENLSNEYNEDWDFRCDDSRGDLCNSIYLNRRFFSFGIGSFILDKIIKTANINFPDARLGATLEYIEDLNSERKIRRDRMYKNAGFIVEDRSIKIDKISNLKFDRKFEHINKVDISEFVCGYFNKEETIKKLSKDLEDIKVSNYNNDLETKNKMLMAQNVRLTQTLGIIILVILISLYVYLK